jgi:hypothetical protein
MEFSWGFAATSPILGVTGVPLMHQQVSHMKVEEYGSKISPNFTQFYVLAPVLSNVSLLREDPIGRKVASNQCTAIVLSAQPSKSFHRSSNPSLSNISTI